MYPLGSILRHHCINYHIYADDTQLYITFDLSDPSIAIEKLNLCISDIRTWMIKNKLKINDSKTDMLSDDACSQLIHALVTVRIDYCNSLLYGLPEYSLDRLQKILNTAARSKI